MDDAAKTRAAARAGWPIRSFRLGEEDHVAAPASATPSECIEMVQILTRRAWELSGASIPRYARAEMPGRIIRNHGRGR